MEKNALEMHHLKHHKEKKKPELLEEDGYRPECIFEPKFEQKPTPEYQYHTNASALVFEEPSSDGFIHKSIGKRRFPLPFFFLPQLGLSLAEDLSEIWEMENMEIKIQGNFKSALELSGESSKSKTNHNH